MIAFTSAAWFGFAVVCAGVLLFAVAAQVEMRVMRRKRDRLRARYAAQVRREFGYPS